MDKSDAGKGDSPRPEAKAGAYRTGHQRIFGVDIRIPPEDHPDYKDFVNDIMECLDEYYVTDLSCITDLIISTLIRKWGKG